MLRPEQIANAKFTPVSTGTYSAEEVDAFLKLVADAYAETLKEKEVLIKKISILAEKVESYRGDEEAIKLSLLDAHKMAAEVTKNAEEQARTLVSDAEASAKEKTENAEKQAAELSDAARLQAGDIVNNARTAVASLKERAQQEADKTVDDAKAQAEVIIAKANAEHDSIVGNSKGEYEHYVAELDKVRNELAKFKSLFEGFNVGEAYVATEYVPAPVAEPSVPVIEKAEEAAEEIAEEIIEEPAAEAVEAAEEPEAAAEPEQEKIVDIDIPVFDLSDDNEPEIPFFEEPEEEIKIEVEEEPAVVEEPVIEEPVVSADALDDLDDLFNLFDDEEVEATPEGLASDIDDILPEPSVPDFSAASEESAEEEDDIFGILDEVSDDAADDSSDDDITSLFDSLFDE